MTRPVTAIIPRVFKFDRIPAEIEQVMRQTIAPEVKALLEEVSGIKNWRAKLVISQVFKSTNTEVSVFSFPDGAEGDRDKWRYLTFGTPPHKIPKTPKPVGQSLKFKWGGPGSYRPKTYPFAGPPRLGGGQAGTYRYFKQVDHPGIEPRYFEKRVKTQYRARFHSIIREAVKRGIEDASKLAR